jgi:hypothetical protein
VVPALAVAALALGLGQAPDVLALRDQPVAGVVLADVLSFVEARPISDLTQRLILVAGQ